MRASGSEDFCTDSIAHFLLNAKINFLKKSKSMKKYIPFLIVTSLLLSACTVSNNNKLNTIPILDYPISPTIQGHIKPLQIPQPISSLTIPITIKDCKWSLQCIIDSISEKCDPINAHLLSRWTSDNNENRLWIISLSLSNESEKCILKEERIIDINADCFSISTIYDGRYEEFGISPKEVDELRDRCYQKNKEWQNTLTTICPIENTYTLKKFFQKSMDEDGLYNFEFAQNEFSPLSDWKCSQYTWIKTDLLKRYSHKTFRKPEYTFEIPIKECYQSIESINQQYDLDKKIYNYDIDKNILKCWSYTNEINNFLNDLRDSEIYAKEHDLCYYRNIADIFYSKNKNTCYMIVYTTEWTQSVVFNFKSIFDVQKFDQQAWSDGQFLHYFPIPSKITEEDNFKKAIWELK